MLELNSETDGTSDNEHYFQNMGNSLTINMVDRNYSTIGLSPQKDTLYVFTFAYDLFQYAPGQQSHESSQTSYIGVFMVMGFLCLKGFLAALSYIGV